MSIGTTAIIGGALGLAGAGVAAGTSLTAAGDQQSASENAQQLQAQEASQALAQNQSQFNTTQANEAPFIQAGQGAVTQLSSLLQPGGALTQQWNQQFQPPTAQQAAATPGYQFALQQGTAALDNSAAAAGGLGSGATGAALEQFGQGLADENYQNTFNNALTAYNQSYNQFQQGQANTYNRLAGLAGTGQVATGQLGSASTSAAGNASNTLLTTAGQQGQTIQNAGAANASGYVGVGNAITSGLNNTTQLAQLYGIQNGVPGVNNATSTGDGESYINSMADQEGLAA